MLKTFQARHLLNALVAVAFVFGYSHQMSGQFSDHHHAGCEHAQTSQEGHDHDDHDHDSHDDDSSDTESTGDCTCLICGLSFADPVVAPIAFCGPDFLLTEIPARLPSQDLPPFALGIDHPPCA